MHRQFRIYPDPSLAFLLERSQPLQMALLHRAKLNGLGQHYGVHLRYHSPWDGWEDEVFDLQSENGLRAISIREFSSGRPLVRELELSGYAQTAAAWERLKQLVLSPPAYDMFQQNCEHVARRIMLGESNSVQVSGAAFVGLAFLGLLLLGKAG